MLLALRFRFRFRLRLRSCSPPLFHSHSLTLFPFFFLFFFLLFFFLIYLIIYTSTYLFIYSSILFAKKVPVFISSFYFEVIVSSREQISRSVFLFPSVTYDTWTLYARSRYFAATNRSFRRYSTHSVHRYTYIVYIHICMYEPRLAGLQSAHV